MHAIKYLLIVYCTVDSAVLDPALFLAPSPPLLPSGQSLPPEKRWAIIPDIMPDKVEDQGSDITVIGIDDVTEKDQERKEERPEKVQIDLKDSNQPQTSEENNYDQDESSNLMGPWNIDRSFNFGLQPHIPLTFSYTGGYGGYKHKPSFISPHYGTGIMQSLSGLYGNFGDSALAGSSYRTYGAMNPVRIYGNSPSPSWSGWGNGKWGHYGEG